MAAATREHDEPSSSTSGCSYHVFLCFRGEDTRYTFADHLFTALKSAGFQTFRDEEGIERGGNISDEIEKAIHDSKLSIIVFSKDFASSEWCLDELAMFMERRRSVGHVVMPLFYRVDPQEVSEQTGSFKEAFTKHEREKDDVTVNGWRAALKEVSVLSGDVLKAGYESHFIQDIVKKASDKLNRAILHVPSCLIGITSRVKDINIWLEDGSNRAAIGVIYGVGGVGKTTIAKVVYNMKFDKFESSSFLADIRESSKHSYGLVQLQEQLLSDILKGRTNKIRNVHEGTEAIKNAVQHQKVLIILDDVDQLEQFKAIIGTDCLYPGSKIIITSRHKRFLNAHEDCEMFAVKELNINESLRLFSWHAFRQAHPNYGYTEHSLSVVEHCGGLPLILEILGSCLSGRSIDLWESALKEPGTIDGGKGQRILRISYDSLQNDRDKNLFLDVACFFIGEDKDYVDRVLESSDVYRVFGVQDLIDRYLITIDECNKLMMHQSLRDMAREIVREESPEELGKRSRLWCHEDAFTVLTENTGTESIRSITLNQHQTNMACRMDMDLKTTALSEMCKLKLLRLNDTMLTGDYTKFPRSLIWLSWHRFPLVCIPTDFYLEKLVVLDMRHSSLKYVWEGIKHLPKLKILDLSHSQFLVRTPNFTGVPSLERLMLKDCINLIEVDESIEVLEKLVFFNLNGCEKLKMLSNNIGMLKSLDKLFLCGCPELNELPNAISEMRSLRVFYANGTSICQPRFTDGTAKNLRWFSPPHFLVKLSLADCNIQDGTISDDFGHLSSLKYLNLSGNQVSTLPKGMDRVTNLQSLLLERCTRLQSLPELPTNLEELNLKDCTSLERITNLLNLLTSLRFNLSGCKNLVEVQGLFKLDPMVDVISVIINDLWQVNVEFLRSEIIKHVPLQNDMTITCQKASIQVLHECGTVSFFLHGPKFPKWYRNRNNGSEISFNVPPIPYRFIGLGSSIICNLNLCVGYRFFVRAFEEEAFMNSPYAIVRNETKGLKWIYSPMFYLATYGRVIGGN